MDYEEYRMHEEFRALTGNSYYQTQRADAALRAGRPQTAKKHVLSAICWLAEARMHGMADRHSEDLENSSREVYRAFDRLHFADRLIILLKVCLAHSLGRVFGEARAMRFVRAWQEVKYGR